MPQPQNMIANRLLAALPPEDFALFDPHLRRVSLEQRRLIYEVGDVVENVYFPLSGVASVVVHLSHGASVEVGMVGLEGLVGFPVLFSDRLSAQHVVQQLPGEALQMPAAKCKQLFDERQGVRATFLQFINAFFLMSAQSAACNRFHSVEQRLARWLLMSSDRLQSDLLPLTQEYIATMLGVPRPGVSEVAAELQRSGLIRYHHGQVTILDHEGLVATACECYATDRARFIHPVQS